MNIRNTLLALATLVCVSTCSLAKGKAKDPVDYVNPYIGNISHLLVPTFPTVQLPNSMLRVFPVRADYTSELLDGLPVLVTNHRKHSAFRLSVTRGEELCPVIPMTYDNEHITPYSFDVDVADGVASVRFAVAERSAVYSVHFNRPGPFTVLLTSMNGAVKVDGNTVSASQKLDGRTTVYVYMVFDSEPMFEGILTDGRIGTSASAEGRMVCGALKFAEETVGIRYGVSFISVEQAKSNLEGEITDFDVDVVASRGRSVWNTALSKIRIKGGSEDDKTVFYTSYYRTFERPVCISEGGRYWSAFDGKVHDDNGTPFYTDDWIWDTYRAAHPLRTLLDVVKEEDILASYLRMAEQMGDMWMPTFPEVNGDSRRMNSNHAIPTFADAIAKGLKVDKEKAFEASYKGLKEKTLAPWCGNAAGWIDEFYWKYGYVPALKEGEKETDPNVHPFEKRQPVAVSLGTAYDCWCISRIAGSIGRKEDAEYFLEQSFNYRKLFNDKTSFFHPKDRDGNWIEPLDYDFPGGMGAREYYDENNAWVYRWDVQHNIPDLIALMGGPEKFIANLDCTFTKPLGRSKYEFFAKLPDHTGNVGQFSMANEPSLHIPYLYNYAGAPWKTQKRIRQMLRTWFRNDLMGVPGDEDGGGLTSFVVFSSVGLYPVTPGDPVYTIGSPLFEESELHLSNGKTFKVIAHNVSDDNKYIQSAALNGKPLNNPWISHETVMKGGTLVLEMGGMPDKDWGTN